MSKHTDPPQPLVEEIQDWKTAEILVDQDNRLVKNIALTGRVSRNGYRYAESALKDSVPLYENKPVFLDHAKSQQQPHQRSTRDLVGSVVNVRYENGRIRGDIRVLETEAGQTFLALAESNGPSVGMSHVVLAEKNADGRLVEKIHEVVSVDAVVFPATTKSLREQESVVESRHELSRDPVVLQQEVQRLQAELGKLQTQRDVEQLIDQSELPREAVTDGFREQLSNAATSQARLELIQERQELINSLTNPQSIPYSTERQSQSGLSLTDEQLINAIHRN